MQKVLRRSLLARNQTLRKTRRDDKKEFKRAVKEFHRDRIMGEKVLRGYVRAERSARREDWFLGPLAPQRDVGEQNGVYGAMSPIAMREPKVPERYRAKYLNFTVGDRVVAVRGRPKGKIAKITAIDEEALTVTLEGTNRVDQEVPESIRGEGHTRRAPYEAIELPIPIDDIRLVVPMKDNKTNSFKDIVVRHLRGGEPIVEREYGVSTPTHTRYIEGLDIEIPWPQDGPPDFKAEESDTLRLTVEEKTYVPSINPPFPTAIIDELRDPFNRERSRHEQNFIDSKLKEDALEAWRKSRRLQTPQAEFLERKAKEKREGTKAEVTNDLLELIRHEQSRTLDRKTLEATTL